MVRARALRLLLAAGLGCAGEAPAPEPEPEPDWHQVLVFEPRCAGVDLGVEVQGQGWSAAPTLDLGCDGLATGALDAAAAEVLDRCVDAPESCAAVASDLALEVERLAARPSAARMSFAPVDPDALPERGTDADLEIVFVDGSSETWAARATVSWGERYVAIGPDGALDAQGSRVTERVDGSAGCLARRDHTIVGTLDGFDVDVAERNVVECDLATLELDYGQRVVSSAAR